MAQAATMRVVKPHLLVFLLMLLPAEESDAQSFRLDALAESALSTDCLDWKIDGICIWIRCSIFGCYVVTSPLISHRLPDLVVQSYINPGEPPWQEWKPIAKALATASSSIAGNVFGFELGGGTAGTGASVHKFSDSLQYYETDAVGNPIAALASRAAGPFLCQSDVTPMLPYFSAAADAASWRSGIAELNRSESLMPGQREVGSSASNTWGPIYPRTGFLIQSDPARAAAVTATRAIDIVSNDPAGHVVKPYKSSTSTRHVRRGDPQARTESACTESGGTWQVNKGDGKCRPAVWRQWRDTGNDKGEHWQMITPEPTKQCRAFGTGESPSAASKDGSYAWCRWIRYRCCMKLGSAAGVLF